MNWFYDWGWMVLGAIGMFALVVLMAYLPDQREYVDTPDGRCVIEIHEVNSLFGADSKTMRPLCEQETVPVPGE